MKGGSVNSFNTLSYFTAGLVLVLIGLPLAIWGLRLWKQPASLHGDSKIYRYLVIDWQTWPRRRNAEKLTEKQIKYYGMRGLLAGLLSIIIGLILMCDILR